MLFLEWAVMKLMEQTLPWMPCAFMKPGRGRADHSAHRCPSFSPTLFTNPNRNGDLHPVQQTEEPPKVPPVLPCHHPAAGLQKWPDSEWSGCQLVGAHERSLPERRRVGELYLLSGSSQW